MSYFEVSKKNKNIKNYAPRRKSMKLYKESIHHIRIHSDPLRATR